MSPSPAGQGTRTVVLDWKTNCTECDPVLERQHAGLAIEVGTVAEVIEMAGPLGGHAGTTLRENGVGVGRVVVDELDVVTPDVVDGEVVEELVDVDDELVVVDAVVGGALVDGVVVCAGEEVVV